ncbi:MAG: glycosyltransferase family 39 protein [Armatimonadetes bacterium]|nr:glycosyltransferase family 39 protein [Armatimonadota bacterium]
MGTRKKRKHKSVAGNAKAAQSPKATQRDPARRMLRAIAIAYLFIAASYATSIPLGKGPDETAHVRYIEFLAHEHRLPVFDAANPDPNYEFHQPPLYYGLSVPVYLLAGGGDSGQQAVRFFTLLLSLALVYLTFHLARFLAEGLPWVAAAAAGVVAFLPMQLSVATTIGNDALTEVLAAGVLLLLVRYLQTADQHRTQESRDSLRPTAMISVGILLGLGLLTKSIAVLVFPVAWVAAWLAARGHSGYRWRQLGRDLVLTTGVALAIAGWWLVRNQVLYGDPLAQRAFLDAFEGLRPSPQSFMKEFQVPSVGSYVGQVMIWTMASATGVFGPVSGNRFAFFPYYIYFATGGLALTALFGFGRWFDGAKLARGQRQAWALCGLFGLLLLASFIRFNFSFFQAQARYLFPALPVATAAFALGLQTLFPPRWQTGMLVAVVSLIALLAFLGLHLWIAPQF